MTVRGPTREWPNRPPPAEQLLAVIRDLALGGCPIGWTPDVEDALAKADLDLSDIIRAFSTGDLVGAVTAGDDENEWVCTIAALVMGGRHKRELGIMTVVIEASSLLIAKVRVSET